MKNAQIVSMTTIELVSADAALVKEAFWGPVMAGFFGVSGQVCVTAPTRDGLSDALEPGR